MALAPSKRRTLPAKKQKTYDDKVVRNRPHGRRRPKSSHVTAVFAVFALFSLVLLIGSLTLQPIDNSFYYPTITPKSDHGRPDSALESSSGAVPLPDKSGTSRFFLHIGPHKTATTSIQCALYNYSKSLKENDAMVFLGKVDPNFCHGGSITQDQRIRDLGTCILDPTCASDLTREWQAYREKGMDLVLSKESLSDWASEKHSSKDFREKFWAAMADSLRSWDVTVVVAYRRFYEWLPSAFSQHSMHMRLQLKQPYPEANHTAGTVEDLVDKIIDTDGEPPYPFADIILKHKFPVGWKTRILNVHDTNDVVKTFICEVLQAGRTCQTYSPLQVSRTSPAEDLSFDFINIQALHWGWMPVGRRGKRMRETRHFARRTNLNMSDFPYICPGRPKLERLLAHSIVLEQKLVGNTHVEAHSLGFWKKTGNYCTINASAVLLRNPKAWKDFYYSMK